MGGSWGGKGEMGEAEAKAALSGRRGEAACSVDCDGTCDGDGEGSGWAGGLETGSGEARLEALRFAWPGRR